MKTQTDIIHGIKLSKIFGPNDLNLVKRPPWNIPAPYMIDPHLEGLRVKTVTQTVMECSREERPYFFIVRWTTGNRMSQLMTNSNTKC